MNVGDLQGQNAAHVCFLCEPTITWNSQNYSYWQDIFSWHQLKVQITSYIQWLGNTVSLIKNNIWLPAVGVVSQLSSKMPLFIFYFFIHLINTYWVPDMCHSSVIPAQIEKRLYHHSKQTLGVNLLTGNERISIIWKDNKCMQKNGVGLHLLQPLT